MDTGRDTGAVVLTKKLATKPFSILLRKPVSQVSAGNSRHPITPDTLRTFGCNLRTTGRKGLHFLMQLMLHASN